MLKPLALLLVFATPLWADPLTVTAGASLGVSTKPDPQDRLGAGTWIEAEAGGVYAGASLDISRNRADDEIDLYLGYGASIGALEVDGSYTRYIYPQDGGDCCGDLDLTFSLPIGALTAGLDLTYAVEDKTTDAAISLDYSLPLAEGLTLASAYTSNSDRSGEWSVGASYERGGSTLSVGLKDGTDYAPYLALGLSWETSLLRGGDL